MAFNLKRGLTAVATGGLSEALPALGRALGPKKITQGQVPLETPEQTAARKLLLNFANTGKFGNFTAGESVPLGYGDFNLTDTETQGLGNLRDLLSSTLPSQLDVADRAINSFLDVSPDAIDAQYAPFKDRVDREIAEATTAAKRNAAYTGNLYSTRAVERLGDVQARGVESLTSKLAELTDSALNRRLSAIPLALQSGGQREALSLGRINASQLYGGLPRTLRDAEIKARDAETLRRRAELLQPLSAAGTVVNSPVNFGVPEVTTSQPSTLMQLLQLALQGGALFAGAKG